MSDLPGASGRAIQTLAAACESRDWPWALTILFELPCRMHVREIVASPGHAREIAFGAMEAPWTVVSELWDSLEECPIASAPADVTELPSRLAEWFFSEASSALRQAEEEGDWVLFCVHFETLLELPAASERREQLLLDIVARLDHRARTAQAEILATCGRRVRLRQSESDRFLALIAVLGNAAQSTAYHDIPRLVLPRLLANADWPILAGFDPETIALLTPELSELRNRPLQPRFSPAAHEWLMRHMRHDGADTPHQPGEGGPR